MVYLAAGVVIAIALTILNLLLTSGVIRRLREHTEQLAAGRAGMGPKDFMVGVGESPGSFTATTTDGEEISQETLVGEQLVGFFSPSCQPCKEKAPLFAQHAAAGRRTGALAVVIGGPDEVGDLVARFEPVARVVVEPSPDGSLAQAFKVKGFPAVCTLDGDGVVTGSGFEVLGASVPSLVS